MDVIAPTGRERRLLVELLAAEGDAEATTVGDDERRSVAESLFELGWVSWVNGVRVRLTTRGRDVAQRCAERMLTGRTVLAS